MKQEQFEQYVQWFGGFIQQYYSLDGDEYLNNNLHLKECHTHRVCGLTQKLAAALKLDAEQTRIAETIALFHDVGRFEQFKIYRTYKDATSEDHASMGLAILRRERLLEPLDKQERHWIERAIEYHNKKSLPDGLDEPTALFSKMIRDTDKVDIFKLSVESFQSYHQNPCTFQLEIEFPDEPCCSPEIVKALQTGTLIDYRCLRTMNDVKLLQLGWAYDIYFDATLLEISKLGYFQQIIAMLPDNKDVQNAAAAAMRYVQRRIGK
jgi:putative nucleotidyltransferase with HDIG domain